MHVQQSMNIDDISIRASSYGMKGITLDGNDVVNIYQEIKKAKEYVKKNGPMLMVLDTYRWMGHSKSDAQLYREKDEVELWKEKCPIKRHREYLLENKVFTEKELEEMQKKAVEEVKGALEFAENSPEPKIENIFDDLYA